MASEQTRTLFAQGPCRFTFRTRWERFKAIFEKHLPVRILTEYDLEDADLQGVRVLVLPNVACLSIARAEVIRRYVAGGGGLVASFETSLYDEQFQRRTDFALADVLQAHYQGSAVVTQRTDNLYLPLTTDHSDR